MVTLFCQHELCNFCKGKNGEKVSELEFLLRVVVHINVTERCKRLEKKGLKENKAVKTTQDLK